MLSTAGDGEPTAAAAEGDGTTEAAGDAAGDAAGEAAGDAAGLAAADGDAATAGEAAAGAVVGLGAAGAAVGAAGAGELHPATTSIAAARTIGVGDSTRRPRRQKSVTRWCTSPFYVARPSRRRGT